MYRPPPSEARRPLNHENVNIETPRDGKLNSRGIYIAIDQANYAHLYCPPIRGGREERGAKGGNAKGAHILTTEFYRTIFSGRGSIK